MPNRRTEAEEARVLANKVLDRVNADLDDDLAVLARQLLRADAQINAGIVRAGTKVRLTSTQKINAQGVYGVALSIEVGAIGTISYRGVVGDESAPMMFEVRFDNCAIVCDWFMVEVVE